MPGSSRFAQSSSVKQSAVASNAINAAIRAWTNGSRNDRRKAAVSTFSLVCPTPISLLSSRGRWSTYAGAKVPSHLAKTYRRVGANTRLLVVGRLCQIFE